MTTTLPTPAEFLAQPSDPEDDDEIQLMTDVAAFHADLQVDPLASIAESMRTLVGLLTPSGDADDLEAGYRELQDQLDQVLTIIKPSTSKLANAIRAVLAPEPEAAAAYDQPADDAPVAHPADDASVEEWRAFGERRGLDLTDNLNRSQIRSALGIPQLAEVSA